MGRVRNVVCLFAALTTLRAAGAQVQAGDNTPRKFRIPAAVIAPGQYAYQTTLERGAGTTVLGMRTVKMVP